ncbi:MAG: shikimate dehydrogenase [Candidatus Omnitrophota bacterium]
MAKLYGLIGFPVKHSYSAIMHNAAFREMGIDARYELFEVKAENLGEEFRKKVGQGICGLNITIPYKEKIIEWVDQLQQEARLIGAVNTIKVDRDKTTRGFNTDGLGFITHLQEVINFNPEGKRTAVLGAGGAARAVSVSLAQKAKEIALFDIDKERALRLKEMLTANFSGCVVRTVSETDDLLDENTDLLVNATPCGMHKGDPLLINPDKLHKRLFVYDLIYNPGETPLLSEAKRRKCAGIFNGLGMLLYQGALAFKIWLEVEAPIKVMEQALKEALSQYAA